GARPREPAELRLIRHDGGIDRLPSKVPHMQIRAGEKFICVGPAGGGFGDPLARDPARVREDITDGVVSAEAAKSAYGVVLSAPGIVDEAATARLRGPVRQPPVDPQD